ncbi:hypothetical protein NDU88_003953 [Pleurodeles waltl]|uniref:Uncharacterized protein n=1 Tax=Pleurodeles waltl TaxID=8319 RepID=A0AAV7NIB4_PLEWA|nr:hypothetical protein NDU88_003953 [Pleurodeles waltl]
MAPRNSTSSPNGNGPAPVSSSIAAAPHQGGSPLLLCAVRPPGLPTAHLAVAAPPALSLVGPQQLSPPGTSAARSTESASVAHLSSTGHGSSYARLTPTLRRSGGPPLGDAAVRNAEAPQRASRVSATGPVAGCCKISREGRGALSACVRYHYWLGHPHPPFMTWFI